ncbi:MFS transporter [Nocardia sp. NPDC050697]|uniref:MFS transporter n=1 Tax=Nocardia sp. NPDC050697 TaxID=3155158 RepID=UPI0033E1306D
MTGAVGTPVATGLPRAAWLALGACVLAVFMQMLDTTIVNTALPALADELAASGAAQVMVVAAYSLAFACTLLTAARLGAVFGRRRVFLGAVAAFVAASLWCGLARHAPELVAARAVQGVAAAGMAGQTIAIITACFPPARRTVAFALYGAAAGVAAMAGPLLGGALVTADPGGLGWRAIFLINVPLGALGFALALRAPAPGRGERSPIDPAGVLLATTGLFLLLFPLVLGNERHWSPGLLAVMTGGLVVLGCFVRQQRRAPAPLLETALFAERGFAAGTALTAGFFALFAAFLFTVSVTAQTGLGLSALETGLLMLPFAAGGALGAVGSPIPVRRWGSRALTAGLLLFGAGVALAAATLHPAAAAIDPALLIAPVFLAGAGMGLFAAPLPACAVAGLDERTAAAASGVLPTVQQLGTSAGLALGGVLFFGGIGERAPAAAAHATAALADRLPGRGDLLSAFTSCATTALTSDTPRPAPQTCATGDPAVDGALHGAARLAAGEAFLGAHAVVLWAVAAGALALAALTPLLRVPERSTP